jgi:hypothetical protein
MRVGLGFGLVLVVMFMLMRRFGLSLFAFGFLVDRFRFVFFWLYCVAVGGFVVRLGIVSVLMLVNRFRLVAVGWASRAVVVMSIRLTVLMFVATRLFDGFDRNPVFVDHHTA